MPAPLPDLQRANEAAPEFCRIPAGYIHPARFHGCVPDLPVPLAERLLAVPRLRRKLSEIIVSHYGLIECGACDPSADRAPSAWPAERLLRLAHRAGGVWHALSLRSLIRSRSLAQLLAAFDEDLRAVAIRHIDLAPADAPRLDAADLMEAVRRDGMHCLNVWVAELPPCSRDRIILKFAPDSVIGGPSSAAYHERGILIVNRLLTESVAAPAGGERQ